jgi:hypothetical protein
MAPGIAGNVYAFSLRFEKGVLSGDLQEVQPFEVASHQRVNIRWDTQSPYPNATWLLGGVAQVELPHGYQKLGQDGIQIQCSGDDFFWDHVQQGHGSALILLLPVGYTLAHELVPASQQQRARIRTTWGKGIPGANRHSVSHRTQSRRQQPQDHMALERNKGSDCNGDHQNQ